MCKADRVILGLRAGEEPGSHPTYSQTPTHKCPGTSKGLGELHRKPCGSHSGQPLPCVQRVVCEHWDFKKIYILEAGIKKLVKLGYCPGQDRHLWRKEN